MSPRSSIHAKRPACQCCRAKALAFLLVLLPGAACNSRPDSVNVVQNSLGEASPSVRAPAVAGLFYPKDSRTLAQTIDRLLESAPAHYIPRLRALVCPHAGYSYSGQTAAAAYKLVAGREFRKVIILAPSHYAAFVGASVPRTTAYETPLGLVSIPTNALSLARTPPFVLEPACRVQRPSWFSEAPKPAPKPGADTPDTWEHSAEVQVPFLQRTMKNFEIFPIIFGEVDPAAVAKVLASQVDDRTLIVASSDLSHYHPYDAAKKLDQACVSAIVDQDIAKVQTQEACGQGPILALLHLAKQKGWRAQRLEYRNSGDVTGQKNGVVGYAAIAFYESVPEAYSIQEREFLLRQARQTLARVTTNGVPFKPAAKEIAPALTQRRACFVTLTKNGELRGCIGHLTAIEPLYLAVAENTENAALSDPRFPPVQADEVSKLKIEISVLTEPSSLAFDSADDLLAKLHPYEDGVRLTIRGRTATFLPQVWAQLPEKVEFLNHLAQKAGFEPSAWRGKETSVSVYHVEAFEEPE